MEQPIYFPGLVREHTGLVRGVLRRTGVDRHDLDDLVQVTFLTAFRRMATYRRDCSIRGWLRAIARFVARNHARGERRRRQRVSQLAWITVNRIDERPRAHSRLDLARALRTLSTRRREVVELRLLDGCSIEETAIALRLNPHTVRSRLASARLQLRRRHPTERE